MKSKTYIVNSDGSISEINKKRNTTKMNSELKKLTDPFLTTILPKSLYITTDKTTIDYFNGVCVL